MVVWVLQRKEKQQKLVMVVERTCSHACHHGSKTLAYFNPIFFFFKPAAWSFLRTSQASTTSINHLPTLGHIWICGASCRALMDGRTLHPLGAVYKGRCSQGGEGGLSVTGKRLLGFHSNVLWLLLPINQRTLEQILSSLFRVTLRLIFVS